MPWNVGKRDGDATSAASPVFALSPGQRRLPYEGWPEGSPEVRGLVAAVGHELIELGLILGAPQTVQKAGELLLLLFEPFQRLGPVIIEGGVAARWRSPGNRPA